MEEYLNNLIIVGAAVFAAFLLGFGTARAFIKRGSSNATEVAGPSNELLVQKDLEIQNLSERINELTKDKTPFRNEELELLMVKYEKLERERDEAVKELALANNKIRSLQS